MSTDLNWTSDGLDLIATVSHDDGDYLVGVFKAEQAGYDVRIQHHDDFVLSGYWFERQREAKAFCEGAMAMLAIRELESGE